MKKISEIFTAHRHAIIWTICYILIMDCILGSLFNFDMFSRAAWVRLMHSRLYGFGGFVFGILILAALPLYAATTAVIMRTQKPLFTLWVPGFIKRAFAPPPPPADEKADAPAKPEAAAEPEPEKFPDSMPAELRGAFIRARRGGTRIQVSAFDNSHIIAQPEPQPVMAAAAAGATDTADDFPIPTDFDMSYPPESDDAIFPSFKDINFDDAPAASTPAPATSASTTPPPQIPLDGAHADGDFIIYKNNLIAVHDDPDFWIADDTDWFASGKQRPSPIAPLKQRAVELGLTPVLYLARTNILDLDARIEKWTADDVTVISNLDDLK
ncbi:MAG: hypothetical protein K2L25_03820 [Alphaproteobacteria bacterium]|nr:hypothetical protein [Alphaproteobacteria bacterium]